MRIRFWLGLLAVAAIAVGSVLGALAVRAGESDAFERGQREAALLAAHQAEAVAALSVGQLASAAAFYQTQGKLTRHEFDVMAASLLRTGALIGTAFVPAVERSERAAFERETGLPIREGTGDRGLRRSRARDLHFPLAFGQGRIDGGYEPPLGYDLAADPVRRSLLLRARDSGEPTATPVIRLLRGGAGINVFLPVYADRAATETVAQRRTVLIGFAAGGFRVPDLAAAANRALPEGVEAQLLQGSTPVAGPDLAREEAAAAPIEIADRQWLLVVRDPNRPSLALPLLMGTLGLSLAALLGALVLVWTRNERMQELWRQASIDSLTGLKNRRRFEEDLRREVARSGREGSDGALLMLDLDNFKQVNDTLGHPIGDRVIGEIAGVLRERTRETDVLARIGGDEFAVVLPNCGTEEARGVAEAISLAVREHVPDEEGVPPITVSIGIAMFGPGSHRSLESVKVEADAAMYAAKDAGRDRVRVSGRETVAQPQHARDRGLEGSG
jgi:diguanylate cyclase (GGDEF)-like protein